MSRNPHIGSSLDDLLHDDGALEEVDVQAIKRVFAWQLEQGRKARGLSKVRMATRRSAKMTTRRSARF